MYETSFTERSSPSFQFQDFRFLCPNDTVFDQQNLVCTNWFEVDCQQSVALFLSDFGRKEEKKTSAIQGRFTPQRLVSECPNRI